MPPNGLPPAPFPGASSRLGQTRPCRFSPPSTPPRPACRIFLPERSCSFGGVMSACACGCGAEVPRNKAGTRRYASDACRARAHRSRESDGALGATDEALGDLRVRKNAIGNALGVEGLSAGELLRLTGEFSRVWRLRDAGRSCRHLRNKRKRTSCVRAIWPGE